MGTTIRAETARRSEYRREQPVQKRPRRFRWRFRWRGLLGLALLAVLAINLYILADNAIRLVKLRLDQSILNKQLLQVDQRNKELGETRTSMQGEKYIKEQAEKMGYTEADQDNNAQKSGGAEKSLPRGQGD